MASVKLGLTGAIGSGKSSVGKMFAALGAYVTEADQIAHDLRRPGQPVYEEILRHFGCDILNPDATIDRKKLADVAFGTTDHPSDRIQELNAIVHPAVAQYQNKWMADIAREHPGAVTIVEAALIFEANLQSHFDRIVVVTCPFEIRVQRWILRNQVNEKTARQELERRMAAQWPEEKKIQAANYVIDNSGTQEETEMQVRKVFSQLNPGR